MPKRGEQVYTSNSPSPGPDESEHQEFFADEMEKLGVHSKPFHLSEDIPGLL